MVSLREPANVRDTHRQTLSRAFKAELKNIHDAGEKVGERKLETSRQGHLQPRRVLRKSRLSLSEGKQTRRS